MDSDGSGYQPREAVAMYGSGLNRESANEVPTRADTIWDQSHLGLNNGVFRGVPAIVPGWRRVFKKSSYRDPEHGRGVLNIEQSKDASINTVIYIPSGEEYDDLIQRESGYGTAAIDPAEITTYLEGHQSWIDELDTVYLFHSPDAERHIDPNPEYVAICMEGARRFRDIIDEVEERGMYGDVNVPQGIPDDFLEHFMESTYVDDTTTLGDWFDDPSNAEQVFSFINRENPATGKRHGFETPEEWLSTIDKWGDIEVQEDPFADLRKMRASQIESDPEPVEDGPLREEAKWMDQEKYPKNIQEQIRELTGQNPAARP